jgi:hypothetical protein
MHHEQAPSVNGHGLLAQPSQQGFAIWRLQHIGTCVLRIGFAHALRDGQQMQVVVAQQTVRAARQTHQAAQRGRVAGATVYQVAQQVEAVAAG